MSEFIEIKATRMSISRRTHLYGVGINDALYIVHPTINGKHIMCPFYRTWANMMKRSYSKVSQKRDKSYIDVTVCKEWHYFSTFKKWMVNQKWENMHLDKDILFPNNKQYSPQRCIFTTRELNNLFVSGDKNMGGCRIGVFKNNHTGKYRATIHMNNKSKYLGEYETESQAFIKYITEKILYVETFYSVVDNKTKVGLKRHIKILKNSLLE